MITRRNVLAVALTTTLSAGFVAGTGLPSMAQTVSTAVTDVRVPDGFWSTFTSKTETVDGITYHYVTGGTGPAMILIHGFPQSWAEWRFVMPELAKHFTVYAVDMKGSGGSDKPFGEVPGAGYDKVTLARELAGLMAALGHDKVDVVGHDIGGMVAYAWGVTLPGTVDRVAIMDVPLVGTPVFDQIRQDPRAWHFSFQAVPELPELLIAGQERLYAEHFMKGFLINQAAFTDRDFDDIGKNLAQPGTLRGAFEYYRAFPQDAIDNAELLKVPLAMPVLAVNGGVMSGGAPFEQQMLQSSATNVTAAVIPDSGHWITEENPAEVAKALIAFFAQ
jgi:pimeloyl-ACP methyl ester carboxylesterase